MRLNRLVSKRDGEPVFEPVDLEAAEPSLVEITGPNGAGKTTLLRTVAGLHTQYDGMYEVPPLLFQGHRAGMDELLNPVENLRWHGHLAGTSLDDRVLREALSRVGMLGEALTPLARLSQGQQRRVGMARWLVSGRALWLLDEPLNALDIDGQALLAKLFEAHVADGGSVLYATHQPLPVAKVEIAIRPAQRMAGA